MFLYFNWQKNSQKSKKHRNPCKIKKTSILKTAFAIFQRMCIFIANFNI